MMEDETRDGYNPTEAKFCASLLWFVCHVGEDVNCIIIPDVTNPFEVTKLGTVKVKSTVIEYLTSATLYLVVVQSITKANPGSFWDLLQVLSQDGIYVIDSNDEPVSEHDLVAIQPFNILAHLALMDAIMKMHSNSLVTINDVITAIKNFSTFNASKELPFDLEDALLLWLNKINQANMVLIQQQYKQQDKNLARIPKSQLIERRMFPLVTDLQASLQDGKTLLSIILFYFEGYLTVDSIKLASTVSFKDRVYNIELFRKLCAEHLCTSVFALSLEDFIYADDHLKINFISLLCEIFFELEIARKSVIVQTDENEDVMLKKHTVETVDFETKPHVLQNNYVRSPDLVHEADLRIKMEDQNGSAIKTGVHQPLLSKRSKKQMAMFQTESRIGSNSDHLSNAVQVFEHKNQPQDEIKSKSRISLDFQPSSASSRSNLYGSSEKDQFYSDAKHGVVLPQTCDHQNKHTPLNSSYSDGVKAVNDGAKHQIISHGSSLQYDSRYFAHQTSKSVQQFLITNQNDYIDNREMSSEPRSFTHQDDDRSKSQENDACYKDISKKDFNSVNDYEEKSRAKNTTCRNSLTVQQSRYTGETDEDDALSTITEATEPEAPSLYSFHSSSTNSSTNTLNYGSSMERLDLGIQKERDYFMDDFNMNPYQLDYLGNQLNINTSGVEPSLSNESNYLKKISADLNNFQSDQALDLTLVNDDNHLIESQHQITDDLLKGSYTINRLSEDAAIAAGLPVITKDNNIKHSQDYSHFQFSFDNTRKQKLSYNYMSESDELMRLPLYQNDELTCTVSKSSRQFSPPHSLSERRTSEDLPAFTVSSDLQNSVCVNNTPPENYLYKKDETVSSNDAIQGSEGRVKLGYAGDKLGYAGDKLGYAGDKRTEHADVFFPEHREEEKHDEKIPIIKNTYECQKMSNKNSSVGERAPLYTSPESVLQSFKTGVNGDITLTHSLLNHPSFELWPFVLNDNQNKMNGLSLEKIYARNQRHHNATTWCEVFDVPKVEMNDKEIENLFCKLQRSKKRAKFTTKRWIDLAQTMQPLNDENDPEPLSSRLAALRMQLEEKRRQFEEEKKRKQSDWNKEKAKLLQNAFFEVVFSGKENQDPNKTIDDCKPTSDICFDGLDKKEHNSFHLTNLEAELKPSITAEKSTELSKQTEKKKGLLRSSTSPGAMWFVGVDEQVYSSNDSQASAATFANNLVQNECNLESSLNNPKDVLQKSSKFTAPVLNGDTFSPEVSSYKNNSSASFLPSSYTKVDEEKLLLEANKVELKQSFDNESEPISHSVSSSLNRLSLNNGSNEMLSDNYFTPSNSFNKQLDNGLEVEPLTTSLTNFSPVFPVPGITSSGYGTVTLDQDHNSPQTASSYANFNEKALEGPPLPLVNNFANSVVNSNTSTYSSNNLSQENFSPSPDKHQAFEYQSINNNEVQHTPQKCSHPSEADFNTSEMKEMPSYQSNTPNMAMDQVIGGDADNKSPQSYGFTLEENDMTPEQQKKKERFIQNRMKKLQIEKEKKKAALEKKTQEEEKLVAAKLLQEEENRLVQEKLKEQRLLDEATSLQSKMYNKRLHELTYNTNQPPRKEQLPTTVKPPMQREENRTQTSVPNHPAYRPHSYTNAETLFNACSSPIHDGASAVQSVFSEYNGPMNYQKPSGKSNKKIMQNAIMHCCLCGEVNKEAKSKCLETIALSDANHFLVLFREGLKFRSVYAYNPEEQTITRIYGIGPKILSPKMISKYYKYNSGAKEFYTLDTKHLSIQVDGVMIKKELWEKKNFASKTDSNLKPKALQNKPTQR